MAKVQHDPIVNAVPTAEKEHIQVHKVQRVAPGTDGMVKLQEAHGALKTVDIADVDLVLGFADGTFIIIPNGALDAIAGTPGKVDFATAMWSTWATCSNWSATLKPPMPAACASSAKTSTPNSLPPVKATKKAMLPPYCFH